MKQKKDLTKLALTAFMLAAAAPIAAQADHGLEGAGTYLAAGCAAHGCAASTSTPSSASNSAMSTGEMGEATNATMNEAEFLGSLTPQGRAIYLSLDPEGKALATQLANQESYKDKNLAVKEAQRRMNERKGIMNH